MAADFDPYYKWLGIPLEEQPPNHYQLLGLPLFTGDPDVIENLAEQRLRHVRAVQIGKHAELAHTILNELAAARACLLESDRKTEYDAQLRDEISTQSSAPDVPALFESDTMVQEAVPFVTDIPLDLVTQPASRLRVSAASRKRGNRRVPRIYLGIVASSLACMALGYLVFLRIAPSEGHSAVTSSTTLDPKSDRNDRLDVRTDVEYGSPISAASQPLDLADSQPRDSVEVSEYNGNQIETPPLRGEEYSRLLATSVSGDKPSLAPQSGVDLLALVDPRKDAVLGNWIKRQNVLVHKDDSKSDAPATAKRHRIQVPYQVPAEYDLRIDIEVSSPNGHVNFGIPAGNDKTLLVLMCRKHTRSKTRMLINTHTVQEASQPDFVLKPGVVHELLCKVRAESIQVFVNEELLVDYVGDLSVVSGQAGWQTPNPRAIAVSTFGADFSVTAMELSPMSVSEGSVPTESVLREATNTDAVPDLLDESSPPEFRSVESSRNWELFATLGSGLPLGNSIALQDQVLAAHEYTGDGNVLVFDLNHLKQSPHRLRPPDRSHDYPGFGTSVLFLLPKTIFVSSPWTWLRQPHDGAGYLFSVDDISNPVLLSRVQDKPPKRAGYFGRNVFRLSDRTLVCYGYDDNRALRKPISFGFDASGKLVNSATIPIGESEHLRALAAGDDSRVLRAVSTGENRPLVLYHDDREVFRVDDAVPVEGGLKAHGKYVGLLFQQRDATDEVATLEILTRLSNGKFSSIWQRTNLAITRPSHGLRKSVRPISKASFALSGKSLFVCNQAMNSSRLRSGEIGVFDLTRNVELVATIGSSENPNAETSAIGVWAFDNLLVVMDELKSGREIRLFRIKS